MSISAPAARLTDVRRRTVLPQTLLGLQLASSATQTDLSSDEYLDKMEEELNRRVDGQVQLLVDGMAELVKMTDIEGKDHFRIAQEAFQAEIRTESMIRAAHSLLALSHTLKLLHLFNDTHTPTQTRERLAQELRAKIEASEREVERLVKSARGRTAARAEEDEGEKMEQ